MNMGEKIPTIVKPLITEKGASFSEGIFQVTTIANDRDYRRNTNLACGGAKGFSHPPYSQHDFIYFETESGFEHFGDFDAAPPRRFLNFYLEPPNLPPFNPKMTTRFPSFALPLGGRALSGKVSPPSAPMASHTHRLDVHLGVLLLIATIRLPDSVHLHGHLTT